MLLRHGLARSRVAAPRNGYALRQPRPVLRCPLQPRAHQCSIFQGCSGAVRGIATPQSAVAAASSSQPPPKESRLRNALVLLVKSAVVWVPAIFFWTSMLLGGPLLDLRTDEEINEDENEVRRLERFFDVEGLAEAEYLTDWTAKEQALSQIVEKILRSQRFSDSLTQGPEEVDENEDAPEHPQKPASWSPSHSKAPVSAVSPNFEVSYVLPPPAEEETGEHSAAGSSAGSDVWGPRLIIASRDGALALVTLRFEYVVKGKDREERWACTMLRTDLVATIGGDFASDQIFDLHGPAPHGVRYMRL